MAIQAIPAYVELDPDSLPMEHPVELDRNSLESHWRRSGALAYGEWALSSGPSGVRPWQLSAGGLFVLGSENSEQGGYFVWGTGSPMESGNFDAASGNPYIATVILHVPDSQYGSVSAASPYVQVYKGTAAASPTALPDSTWEVGGSEYVPGAWFRLGDVRVNPGDTGLIPAGQFTSHNKYARGSAGTILAVSTDSVSDANPGDLRFDVDTGMVRQRTTSNTWRAIKSTEEFSAMQSFAGTDLNSPTNASKVATNLTFPAEANAAYECSYNLRYWAGTAEDAHVDWSGPAGWSHVPNSLTIRSVASSATGNFDPFYKGVFFSGSSGATMGGIGTSFGLLCRVDAVIKTAGVAGPITLLWGQKVAGGNAAGLSAGSTMHVRRVG